MVTKASRVHNRLPMNAWKIGYEALVGCGPKGGGLVETRKFGFFEMQDVETYWYLSHEEFKAFELEQIVRD